METLRTKFYESNGRLIARSNNGTILVDKRERNIQAGKIYDCILTPMPKKKGDIASICVLAKDQIEVITNENSVLIKINSQVKEELTYIPKIDGSSFNKLRAVLRSLFVFSTSDIDQIKIEFEKLEKQHLKYLKRKCK